MTVDLDKRLSEIEARLSAIEARLGFSASPTRRPAVTDTGSPPTGAARTEPHEPPPAPRRPPSTDRLSESALGGVWLARAGMAVLLMGLLFLAKYSWDAGWLGPAARVLTIYAISAGMLAAGEAAMHRPPMVRYGTLLTGGGICASFFATWAAHRLFGLVGAGGAATGYLAATAAGLLLSMRYERQTPAFLGLVGGIATPLLLSTGKPRTLELFAFLSLLAASALWAAVPRDWRPTLAGSLAGAILLYAGWWGALHGLPAPAGFAWQAAGVFLLLAVVFNGIAALREPEAGPWRAVFAFASLALSWALALALERDGWTLHAAIPPAGLSALLLVLSCRVPAGPSNRRRYAALSLAAVLLVPLTQFTDRRFALVLGIEGLALAFAAREADDRLLGRMARLALAWGLLDAARFLPWHDSPFQPWRLLLNERFAVAAVVAGCAAWAARRLPDDPVAGAGRGYDRPALLAAAFAMIVGALSFEAHDAVHRLLRFSNPTFASGVAVTVVWTLCALAAVAWGLRNMRAGARWAGLALFAATLLKVFLFDLGHVGTIYRVVSFLALGGVLLLVAWGYNRFARRVLPLLAALILSFPTASRADFDRHAWSRYRPIDAAPVAEAFRSGKTVAVALPEGLGHDTKRFGDDLRVVDQSGREVPFLLRADRSRPEIVSATAINAVFRAGEQSFEIDPPPGAAACGIELDIDTPAFSRQAELLSAAPGESTFRTVLREGVFHRGNAGPVLTSLAFPPQDNRRLRVVIRGGDEPLSIRRIRLHVASAVPRRTRAVPASYLGSDRNDAGDRSSIRFELQVAYPTDRLVVLASPSEFSRDSLLYRETPAGESLVAGGMLRGRNGRGDDREDGMPVPALERGRYRLEVDDGDSPPLRATGVSLYGPQLFLLFRPASALPHFLFHGHPAARPPVYDLGRILPDADAVSALPASLGPEKDNPDFVGEKAQAALPERQPWLVRVAAILVAILLGAIAWRALKNN